MNAGNFHARSMTQSHTHSNLDRQAYRHICTQHECWLVGGNFGARTGQEKEVHQHTVKKHASKAL